MDIVVDYDIASSVDDDAVLATPRPSGKRKHPSPQQQQQQRDEFDDGIFVTPSFARDANDDKRDDVCLTPRKKQKTATGAVRASSSSLLSPPPLLPKSVYRQRANEVAELTEDDLAFLAFPSLPSSPLSEDDDYPIRLSPRNAVPPRRFCFGIPELAPPERNGLFRIIGEDDRDSDNYSSCSNDGSSSSSFSLAEPPFLAMDDDDCEEGRRHKILLPSLRSRVKPDYLLSVDLSLPSLARDHPSPATPVAA